MKKALKWLAVLAAIGTVIGVIIAFLCKSKNEEEDFNFDSDDDDFDLDSDLQPVEREYVPLNKSASPEDSDNSGTASKEPGKHEKEAAISPERTDP